MSDDTTQPIPAGEPTTVEPLRAGAEPAGTAREATTGDAGAPTTPIPPTPAPAPAAPTGHIRVTEASPRPDERPAAQPEQRTALRVVTVVWGLIVTAVGVGLLSIAWGAHLDAQLALIVLLGAAGVALLVGSLLGMRRSRSRLEGRG